MILDNVNDLYLKWDCTQVSSEKKNNTATMFCLKKSFLGNEDQYEWLRKLTLFS